MSRNKFNLKDKKKKIIISIIFLCIILLGSLGFGLATLNSTGSKDIAYNKNKTENKKEGTSSKEETKTEGIDTSSAENKTENKEETSSGSTNSGNTSNSTSNGTDKENTSTGTESGSSSNESSISTGGSTSSGSGSNSKPSNGGSSNSGGTSKPEAHTHNWVAITQQVHHDEEGHWEEYVVSQAWTEEVPVYEYQEREICNGCGADITSDPYTHNENHMLNGEAGGWTTQWVQVQVGTNKINHPAVTDKKWIVDKAAWTETVTTGYKCSSCGATK